VNTERRLALVITVDRHDNAGLRDLKAPAADAEALADVLGRDDLGGFELEFLHNPTSATTYERVDGLLADRHPSDLVLLHYSGHGLKDLDGELYLATTNTNPGRLASTGVEAAWISRMMQRSRAQRVVLLLDCCYGGAFERGVLARAEERIDVGDQFRPGRLGESRGRVVITASTAMEYAFESAGVSEGSPARPSVFTSALAEGIRTGEADRDQDGFVALDELYDYVYDRVRGTSGHQTPCKWEFGLRGDLYVARNPFRVPPAPVLPAELLELVDHPNAAVRLAAVPELRSVTEGGHRARAAAARNALIRLAEDDSRRVSAAAEEALAGGARPEPAARPDRKRRAGSLLAAAAVLAMTIGVTVNAIGQTHPPAAAPASSAAPVRPALIRVGREPEGVAVSPDNRTIYVCEEGTRALAFIDASSRRVTAEIKLASIPRFVALSADGSRGYVSTYEDDASGSGITVVDVRQRKVLGVIPSGPKPYALAVTRDGQVWAPIHEASRIEVSDGTTRRRIADILVPPNPHAVALSADGRLAYTSDHESNLISVIDVHTRKVLGSIGVGRSPHHLAVAPGDRTVLVVNYDAGTASVIDTASRRVRATIRVGRKPQSVAFNPAGTRAYVVDEGDNAVSVIDMRTAEVSATLAVGASPRSVAVAPDGRTAYVTAGDAAAVSVLTIA
jgi:YVTN family beta-propeller protein